MARPPADEPSWLTEAIERIVRNGITLKQAAVELGAMVSSQECDNISRRRSYQKLLRDARNRYHAEVGADPGLTKASTIGRLSILAQNLSDDGEADKAAEVLYKLSRVAGWIGNDQNVNVFGNLTAKDYAEVRKKLEEAPKPSVN